MFKCPYCKEKTISFSQKLFLIVARRLYTNATCNHCKNKVTSSILFSILFWLVIPFIAFPFLDEPGTTGGSLLGEYLVSGTAIILMYILIFITPTKRYPY